MALWGKTDTNGNEPKFGAHHEAMDSSNFTIYGVDPTEVGVAATTAYAVAHGGWVGITTYTASDGRLRVKNEVIVATGSMTGDQADDAVFADS